METPRHEHDCDMCVYLGNHEEYDLYYHPSPTPVLVTVVARYGKDGDYLSGLGFAQGGHMAPLTEALNRARANGLHPEED